jgi:hypothetical protein
MPKELDEETAMWLILKFGSLEEAWKYYNVPLFEIEPKKKPECTEAERDVIELYRLSQCIDRCMK